MMTLVCQGNTVLVGSRTVGTSFSLAGASSVSFSTPLLTGADHTSDGIIGPDVGWWSNIGI